MRSARGGVVIGCTLFWTLGVLLGSSAWAHTTLVSSTPTDGAQVGIPPTTIELVFSEPVGARLVTVVVSSAGGAEWQDGAPVVSEAVVSQAVRPLTEAGGDYTVAYRVVSDDGHPVSGELRFTLAQAAAPTPTPTSSANAAAAAGSTPASRAQPRLAAEDSFGTAAWTYAAVGLPVAALLFVGGMALARSRGKARSGGGGVPDHGP